MVYEFATLGTRVESGLAAVNASGFERLDLALLYDLISVCRQVLKDCLGNMDALVWRYPFIVQVRTAVAFGILDESRVDRIGDEYFNRLGPTSGASNIRQY
ncbi:hypothetical protein JQ609_32495 [Bradyrhizobium sp. AUGA SZCCT0169]|uniref:hypothetical protein n=1 Tax=unclassified Bradyrhizobium TaxID=2631580 RepID=UPI001BA46E84|nr:MULTISPECIES: hypothetical protein [unclassified Bradyrhizobium]MBR1194075.1 hypothetical protein [Bradyrhizobium sp. AUGA SZCCT0160]MBR1251623.1 hypothetical protein [Bradyrhizobium sp. AUGA SZCCT0169]